jgi:hypothetical protein
VAIALVAAVVLALAVPAHSKTFVIPHVLEVDGGISSTQYTFDHILYAFYGSGLAGTPAGPGASVNLYLFDNIIGDPLQNNGQVVCNPCAFPLGGELNRKSTISVESLIQATGAFDTGVKLGFGVVVVEGDAAGVSLESDIVHSHTSAFDLSILSGAPIRLRSEDPAAPDANVYQLSHVFETAGRVTDTQYAFDQMIYAVYTAGLAGTPTGGGARLDLYLFDNTGNVPLQNNGTNVCDPCSFGLGGGSPRKRSISVDQLIATTGAFGVKLGAAIMVVTGDAGNVSIQAMTVNSHTSAFDLTMSSPPVQPVQVSETLGLLLEPRAGAVARLTASPNPTSGEVRFAIEMARASDVELAIFDVAGRKVATVYQGYLEAGASERRWFGAGLTGRLQSGLYFARLSSADGSSLARVVVVNG